MREIEEDFVTTPQGIRRISGPGRRLRPAFYGLSDKPTLYLQRVNKEALHELGHVLGLDHCTNYCVMRFSNTLADTDEKPDAYYSACHGRLR